MRYLHLLALILGALVPFPAHANQVGPLLPLGSARGWLGLPLIVLIEGFILKNFELPSPFKLALKVNVVSALWGLPLTFVNIFIPIPGMFLVYEPRALADAQSQVNAIWFYGVTGLVAMFAMGWFSYWIELKHARKILEPGNAVRKRPLLVANGISYSILIALYLRVWILGLLRAYQHLAGFFSSTTG